MTPRVALVHDWLTTRGGAERLLESLLGLYPQAVVHTLVYAPQPFRGTGLEGREVRTSFLQQIPGSKTHYRWLLPLMPLAVEQFDMRGFDIVISLSNAVAHGVLLRPDQLHINYVFTPMRYVWPLYQEYLEVTGLARGIRSVGFRWAAHYLRLWDLAAAQRVDEFVAISKWVARRVWRAYRREAQVLYPPADVERFKPLAERSTYYLTVSRLVPYKRIDLLVEAFGRIGRALLVVGTGPEADRLARRAKPNVQILGRVDDDKLAELYGKARAFIYAAEEDFGIAPVEAQAAGCPVIAYSRGGVWESMIEGETGLCFSSQTVEAVVRAVEEFEGRAGEFQPERIRQNALRFSHARFEREFTSFVERAWEGFREDEGRHGQNG
ncbi:MAG TPA: glycosyltransferase [Candidatus Methylomirabilis sp.]